MFMQVSSSSGRDGCLAPGVVDMWVNWYLNKFVKVYFDWEHARFRPMVTFRPRRHDGKANGIKGAGLIASVGV